MSKHRRNWSAEEKEKIVLYYEEHGATSASREFGISTVSIYNWRDKFAQLGKEGFQPGTLTDLERELKELRRENLSLKRIVADKELAIQVKDALLKKSQSVKK
jgi:transposase-like protein